MSLRRQQLLKSLCECPRKQLLKKLTNEKLKIVCECALNLLRGNIPVTKSQKAKLQKHKAALRKLASKKLPLFKKKRVLLQKGSGFLGILLPTALSLLSSIIGK